MHTFDGIRQTLFQPFGRRSARLRAAYLAGALTILLTIVSAALIGFHPFRPPTTAHANASANLIYHGGPVQTNVTVHLIFWIPSQLQDGTPPALPADYVPTLTHFFQDIGGTGLYGILTQYYAESNGSRTYVSNHVTWGGAILDSSPFPSGDCLHYTNCIKSATIENLISRAIDAQHWQTGIDQSYMVFTAPGEIVCAGGISCYPHLHVGDGCAFHDWYAKSLINSDVIYGMVPTDPDPAVQCTIRSFGLYDPLTVSALSFASHEFMEMVTDPKGPNITGSVAWQDANGAEIGDKCAASVGQEAYPSSNNYLPYDFGQANQVLYGDYYLVQTEWSNQAGGCVRNDGQEHLGDLMPSPGLSGTDTAGGPWSQTPRAGPGEEVSLSAEDFAPGETVDIEYETGLSSPAPSQVSLCPTGPPPPPLHYDRVARADGTVLCTDDLPSGALAGAPGIHHVTFRGLQSGRTVKVAFHLEGVQVSPTQLTFGTVAVGSTGTSQTVTVTNIAAQKAYAVSSVQLSTSAAGFTITADQCSGQRLIPGAFCTVQLTFAPRAVGPATALLSIADSGNALPQTLSLTGTGAQPTSNAGPTAITSGPDGNLWFTGYGSNTIGRITPGGQVQAFVVPTANSYIQYGIAPGPKGNLWFTEYEGNQIGQITPGGQVTEYRIPTSPALAFAITGGPDGNIWFTEFAGSKIGRIDPTTGQITEYPLPTRTSAPCGITTGPDGALWFTEQGPGYDNIGRIDPASGQITEYPVDRSLYSEPLYITSGPDGNLWFTESNGNKIGRITPSGQITEYAVPTPSSQPNGITSGPDGNLWFTELYGDKIGRIDPATGQITEFAIPSTNSLPWGIASGPDGNLWFTEPYGNRIGRITPSGQITEFAS